MRIEVIETLSAYERKRWEFICNLDSRGLHIRLYGMRLEQRDSMNKRSPYKPVLVWSESGPVMETIPHTLRMHSTPKVPLGVQRVMRKNLEAAINYNFEVCMPVTEAAPGHH